VCIPIWIVKWFYHSDFSSRAKCAGCTPNGKNKLFYYSNLSSCGHSAKRAGCGRVRSRNIRFGHVPIAVRQGR
jgi:hypothetical protein